MDAKETLDVAWRLYLLKTRCDYAIDILRAGYEEQVWMQLKSMNKELQSLLEAMPKEHMNE